MRNGAVSTGMFLLVVFFTTNVFAQNGTPVIDMHLHSYTDARYFVRPDQSGIMAPPTAEAHFEATYQSLQKNNIVLGMVSNSFESEEAWIARDKEKRFLRGFRDIHDSDWTPERFEQLVKEGKIDVLGEIQPSFYGMTLADPFYEPWLKICEQYGIPVALHTGGAPPGIVRMGFPKARLALGNPMLIEEVLVKYPGLKIYLMHSGERFYQDAINLMLSYPQVYTDLGVVLWINVTKPFGRNFLLMAKEFGLLNRVMFGSDQMVWPHSIEASIEELNSFDFLTEQHKRDILYNNAARFLELSEEQVAEHHR